MSAMVLAAIEKCLILIIIQLSQNVNWNKLVVGKMKDETELKPKMYSFLVDNMNKKSKKCE